MQQMALGWMVYRLTNSPLMLGVIGFTSQAPSLVLTPIAGIIVDRANRHRLILITQTLAMIQAALLTLTVWKSDPQLWELIALSTVLGAITSFDLPSRQAFMVDMLNDMEQIRGAIAVNSSINTLTSMIGPCIAGVVVAWAGERVCFLTNALSYVAVIVALLFVKSTQKPTAPSTQSAFSQLKEGVAYTLGFGPIRDLILLVALTGFLVMPLGVLLPAFAKDVFHGNAMTLGLLTGASGGGSLLGAMFLASRKSTKELSNWLIAGSSLSGVALMALGVTRFLPLAILMVTIVGFGGMVVIAGCMTIIQTIVDSDKRGRVLSFVGMAFLGLGPFGAMVSGVLASKIGANPTVALTGIITLAVAFFFSPHILRIHQRVTARSVEDGIAEAESELSPAA
jgi:MFS family permease